jgi:hypothetical protein
VLLLLPVAGHKISAKQPGYGREKKRIAGTARAVVVMGGDWLGIGLLKPTHLPEALCVWGCKECESTKRSHAVKVVRLCEK